MTEPTDIDEAAAEAQHRKNLRRRAAGTVGLPLRFAHLLESTDEHQLVTEAEALNAQIRRDGPPAECTSDEIHEARNLGRTGRI